MPACCRAVELDPDDGTSRRCSRGRGSRACPRRRWPERGEVRHGDRVDGDVGAVPRRAAVPRIHQVVAVMADRAAGAGIPWHGRPPATSPIAGRCCSGAGRRSGRRATRRVAHVTAVQPQPVVQRCALVAVPGRCRSRGVLERRIVAVSVHAGRWPRAEADPTGCDGGAVRTCRIP